MTDHYVQYDGIGSKYDDYSNSLRPLSFNLILGCAVFLLQGCLLDPYPAELNTTLGDDYTKAIQEKKRCDYRLALDQPSSQYTVTGYKDNYLANAQPYTFPLGATLSSYMSQAQNGEKGDLITLHFHTTNFHLRYLINVNEKTKFKTKDLTPCLTPC